MTLFVSYSSKDEAPVRELVSDLERARQSVWLDQELRGGDPWWQDILKQIRECRVFVFALSKRSADRRGADGHARRYHRGIAATSLRPARRPGRAEAADDLHSLPERPARAPGRRRPDHACGRVGARRSLHPDLRPPGLGDPPPRRLAQGGGASRALGRLGGDPPPLAFFLGDDRTDEDAFASLPDGSITVKVGHPDSPTLARYRLPDPDAVHAFLQWLAERLGA